MLIAHHPHLIHAAVVEPQRPRRVRIDGRSYAATARGSIAAGAVNRVASFERRRAGSRTS